MVRRCRGVAGLAGEVRSAWTMLRGLEAGMWWMVANKLIDEDKVGYLCLLVHLL